MKTIIAIFFLIVTIQVIHAQPQNIMISDFDYPEEPSICINYQNPDHIVAGANIDYYYYSHDGGLTWTRKTLSSSYGVYGDPTIICDKFGHFYYLHLSNATDWLDRIVCQKSTDNGETFNNGTYLGNPGSQDHDKQWAAVDMQNNVIYVTWTIFDAYGSNNPDHKSNILFSKSTDNGTTWSEAKQINQFSGNCLDDDLTTEGAVPAVGPNGEVYVAWAYNDTLYFDRSTDGGETWLDEDIVVAAQPNGWAYDIPGIMRCNGLPVICCDTSHTEFNGNIYVNWTDQRNGINNTDVWLAKSTDGGSTWSETRRVNTDLTETHQFLTWMTIDQNTGYLYVIYYDRSPYTNNYTDVVLAVSKDGGNSFQSETISESPFLPTPSIFFGDYNNISAHDGKIRPIWTRLHENKLSIWTALIDSNSTGNNLKNDLFIENHLYPNPATQFAFFSFKLKKPTPVTLELISTNGCLVKRIVDETRMAGKYVEQIDIKQMGLSPGIYYYVLTTKKSRTIKKLVISN